MLLSSLRKVSPRCVGLLSVSLFIVICIYYTLMGQIFYASTDLPRVPEQANNEEIVTNSKWKKCAALRESLTDITTSDEYNKFDFKPSWMQEKRIWDNSFEERYKQLRRNATEPNLKVFLVPFSHNDPGWLKTFRHYFQNSSRKILNNVISRMQEYTDMTFIWSEICILQMWWDQAHPTMQGALKQLVQSGRFEITTGGWVMTDEANVHVYAMVDQLIEGHQWLKENLNFTPTTGFSIDPFGHGSTLPYLLAASGFEGTIIQRIHYAWKKFLAKKQYGDFYWSPYWDDGEASESRTLLTHNMPFDIYSIRHSCGPFPLICDNFDFHKEEGGYMSNAEFITAENVEAKSDLLLEQYARTASLYPHNVALIPIGDDFRYSFDKEAEQQYTNYKKLIEFINAHPQRYNNTHISFGLPRDYFTEINKRYTNFPHLKGDFFVYSDIYNAGRPAYWSGFYTTRPMYKMLSRELEHNLRAAEILFTVAFNRANQQKNATAMRIYDKHFEKMTLARRNLGLFQHHDAITGTSKSEVMQDYGSRVFESIQDTVQLQERAVEFLMQSETEEYNFLSTELERASYDQLSRKKPIAVQRNRSTEVILFNSLTHERLELISLRITSPYVKLFDNLGNEVKIQINPVWNFTDNNVTRVTSSVLFEIQFIANLPAMKLTKYTVKYSEGDQSKPPSSMATIHCNECEGEQSSFDINAKQPGDIRLRNSLMSFIFDGATGFLKTITPVNGNETFECAMQFAAYRSEIHQSGAYLFKTDREKKGTEKNVLEQYSDNISIIMTSGPITSDVTVIYGKFLTHTVRIFKTGTSLDNAIFIENDIDFELSPKNSETELFMRFITSIDNTDRSIIYTDQNGFQYLRREKVHAIGIEGNYYPITCGAFIQDETYRLTLLTTHAQGAASLEPGYLEVMMDRRTLYDDYRGLNEGIVDSQLTKQSYWLVLEEFMERTAKEKNLNREYELPSHFVNSMTNIHNYPVNAYLIERQEESSSLQLLSTVSLFDVTFPCDVHLTTLRTQAEKSLPMFPSSTALMVLHRQSASRKVKDVGFKCQNEHGFMTKSLNLFHDLRLESMEAVSLTGIKSIEMIESLDQIYIKPMDIVTFNLTFGAN